MMMKMKNRSHGHVINSHRFRHKINISMMSRYDDDAYMYQTTLKQHLKLNSCESHTEAVLKRSVSNKKGRISLVPLTIAPGGWCEILFNLYFCSVVNLKLFFL